MILTALICTRNSDWCIGLTLRAALMYCNQAIVLLHNCTDRTPAIVDGIAAETNRVTVIEVESEHWDEMEHRQMMLEAARVIGSTHIMLIDDDEILSGNLLPSIRQQIEFMLPGGKILQLPWLQLRDGVRNVMVTGMWGSQVVSAAFRDDLVWHWKAQGTDEYHHHHRHPMGWPFSPYAPGIFARDGGLMHLQFSSRRRLLAKQAWYQCVERLRWPDRSMADYRRTVRESEAAVTAPVPNSWWMPYQHLMEYLHPEAEPWQERELQRMIAEHGRERFAGLDLFGL